jgi:hypothetical protein
MIFSKNYLKHNMYLPKLAICAFLMVFSFSGFSQDEGEQVEILRDLRLDELTKKQQQINKATGEGGLLSKYKTSSGKYKGYRLMILNTKDRDLAYQTRGRLASMFPQHKLYMAYQAPYYKLKMGDFLEKSDAEDLKKALSGIIKSGIFTISDVISLRPEEEQRLIEKALNQ